MESTESGIAGIIRNWVVKNPEGPCLSFAGRTRVWREVFDRSSRVGQGLVRSGLRPQDRVVYLGKNAPEFFEVLFGTSMAGGVATAVNWRLAPAEMLFTVNQAKAKALFIDIQFLGHLEQFREELVTVETIVVIGGANGETDDGYEAWLARQSPVDPEVPVSADDTAFQLYTSGTTGLPKGAMFSHSAVRSTFDTADVMGVTQQSVVLVAMPVFHAAGASLGMMALSVGAHCVIAAEARPDTLLPLMERYRVTMTMVVPAVLRALLESPDITRHDVSSLDTIAYAAAPISAELLRAGLDRLRCRFVQLYGMTETINVTALTPEDHLDRRHPQRLTSSGRAMPGVVLRTVNPVTGADAGEGVVGEVWVKAPTNMHGYWESPEETAAAMTVDGFVRSGDAGYLLDGYLYLHDRIKEMIVSGGENVYPIEAERVLMAHPGISDVAVIGVPSEQWGETVKAIVVREFTQPDLSEAEILSYVRQNLAGYKCPKSVEFVDELPRNPSGKVLKRVLRAPYWEGRERRIS